MTTTGVPAPGFRIARLRLFQFRNYREQTVTLSRGVNVVRGANAQGKTNLLEAAAAALLTRSPRTASPGEMICWGSDRAQIDADVEARGNRHHVGLRLDASTGRVLRSATLDGNPHPARRLLGLCPVVLFWPDDLLLVKSGPEGRRRLLDMILSQTDPRLASDLLRYRRVVEQRTALLRHHRLTGHPMTELEAFTAELVERGARIQFARADLVAHLARAASVALHELSGGAETLGMAYATDAGELREGDDSEAAAHRLRTSLRERRHEEIARGATLVGPHRDDILVTLDGHPARTAASQGQQRSIVLALKLAEVRHLGAVTGAAPVLLLDDVLSELDPSRRDQLLRLLHGSADEQVLMTTSEAQDPLEGMPRQSLWVTNGTIQEQS